jgi:hypothetical protein
MNPERASTNAASMRLVGLSCARHRLSALELTLDEMGIQATECPVRLLGDGGGGVVGECPSISLRSGTNDTDAPQWQAVAPANVTTQSRAMTRGEPTE